MKKLLVYRRFEPPVGPGDKHWRSPAYTGQPTCSEKCEVDNMHCTRKLLHNGKHAAHIGNTELQSHWRTE